MLFKPTGNNKISTKLFLLSFWPAIVWGIVILLLSITSGETASKLFIFKFKNADKIAHFGLYFIFSYLLMFGFKRFYLNEIFRHKKQAIAYAVLISIIFGSWMEILQLTLQSTRSAEFFDFVANSIGAVFAIFLFEFIDKIIHKFFVRIKS